MFRQTVVLTTTLFAVWALGVAVLALPNAGTDSGTVVGDMQGPRYLLNSRTTSTYQDQSGRFTVYIRTALRENPDVVEVERF